MVNGAYTNGADPSPAAGEAPIGSRILDAAATVLSLGTNKLVKAGLPWLRRNGLARYVVPALLVNEAFGAWRAYLVMGSAGWW